MTIFYLVIFFVLLGVSGVAFVWYLKRELLGDSFTKKIQGELQNAIPTITQSAAEQTALFAKEKLESSSQLLKEDFANQKNTIQETINRLQKELQSANEKLEKAERERIGSYEGLRQQLVTQSKVTDTLISTTNKLQSVLANNQQRGIFGEQVARDLLELAGFTKGVDFLVQELQEGGRPDFTILLPNKMKINVDAKFPYQNLLRLVEADDEIVKTQHRKSFEKDVKEKIKQVTTREYVNTQENTVDFVILFVPNEKIFSYIYDEMPEVWQEGMRSKVIFAGPFSFTAILRMVRQAYEYFSVQKNLQDIISYIRTFQDEFGKYSAEFDKLGRDIKSVNDQYEKVSTTRTKQLTRVIDKIQLEMSSSETQTKLIE